MTTASRSEREALYLESVESSKDPRDAGPRGKDPGRPWGRTRQSKEAENAFINPRSWPGRRTAVDGADQVVMACVGGWWWWQDRQSQKKKREKKWKKNHRLAHPWWCRDKRWLMHEQNGHRRGVPVPHDGLPPPQANQTGPNQPGRGTAGREGVQGGNGGP